MTWLKTIMNFPHSAYFKKIIGLINVLVKDNHEFSTQGKFMVNTGIKTNSL